MSSTNRVATFILAAASFGAVACSDSTGAGTGTVTVKLTNAAVAASIAPALGATEVPLAEGSLKSVDIFVVRIDAKRTESSDEEAAEDTEASESAQGGWVTVAEPNAVIDLMQIADGSASVLGDAEVAAGPYRSFRLIVDPTKSSVTLNDEASTVIGGESVIGLKLPSAAKTGIKVRLTGGAVEVEDGEETTLLVKFDVMKSFVMLGATIEQNGLLFKPVIHAEKQ